MGLIWGIVTSSLGFIVAILIPVVVSLLNDDIKEWLPSALTQT
jgi:hypothetical protein